MKAIVIGATGLVGKFMVQELLRQEGIESVLLFVRRKLDLSHPKLTQEVISFDQLEDWKGKIQGDLLLSALGTTLKTAGSKAVQFRVDYDYQLEVAKAAASQGISSYVLVSSDGASSSSPFFYLKMKGQLEDEIRKLPFRSITILRPGLLKGEREEKRLMEGLSQKFLGSIPEAFLPANLVPVPGERVARCGVIEGMKNSGKLTILDARMILQSET